MNTVQLDVNAVTHEQLLAAAFGCVALLLVLLIVREVFRLLRCLAAAAGSIAVSLEYHRSAAAALAERLKQPVSQDAAFVVTCTGTWLVAVLALELVRAILKSSGGASAE